MSSNFVELDSIGGCPDGWDENEEYQEGDLVAVVISDGCQAAPSIPRPTSMPVTPKPTSQCFSPTPSPSKRPTRMPQLGVTNKPTTLQPSGSPSQSTPQPTVCYVIVSH